MHVLVAPQELKGTLTAVAAAEAMAQGLARARPDWTVEHFPIADGGPGTLDLVQARVPEAHPRVAEVEDPLGRAVHARWLALEASGTALIEMAQASGLWRVADGTRPLDASTRGTGQLMRDALEAGFRRLVVGAGGSATTDGGCGALAALGARFLDDAGNELDPTPRQLERCARVDLGELHPALAKSVVEVWTDVRAPLLGPSGAARLFGPQKGASASEVERLEATLTRLEGRLAPGTATRAGTGAAGGLAWGLSVWCQAAIHPGFLSLAQLAEIDEALARADLVLTAEGRLDAQSALDKGPWGLAHLAARHGKRAVIFVGALALEATQTPFEAVVVLGGEPKAAGAAARLTAAVRAWAEAATVKGEGGSVK